MNNKPIADDTFIPLDQITNAILKYVVHHEEIAPCDISRALKIHGMPRPGPMTLYRVLILDTAGKPPHEFLDTPNITLSSRDLAFSRSPNIGSLIAQLEANRRGMTFVKMDEYGNEPATSIVVVLQCECPPDDIYFSINDALDFCGMTRSGVDEQDLEWFVENGYAKEDEVLVDGSKVSISGRKCFGVII